MCVQGMGNPLLPTRTRASNPNAKLTGGLNDFGLDNSNAGGYLLWSPWIGRWMRAGALADIGSPAKRVALGKPSGNRLTQAQPVVTLVAWRSRRMIQQPVVRRKKEALWRRGLILNAEGWAPHCSQTNNCLLTHQHVS